MTQSGESATDAVWVKAQDVRTGDALNTHQDVFWEVVKVRDSERHPGCVMIDVVHDRRYTYAADELVRVVAAR